MNRGHGLRAFAVSLAGAMMVAACSNGQEPAKHAVEGVQSAVTAVAPQAQKYLPEQFQALQTKASDLTASFNQGDFKQVLAQAPALLNEAQALGAAATAKKDQIVKGLSAQWTALATSLPDSLATVQDRIDTLSKNKKQPAGVDLPAAKAAIADAPQLWSKAQEALAAGDVESAVKFVTDAQARVTTASQALKLTSGTTPTHG